MSAAQLAPETLAVFGKFRDNLRWAASNPKEMQKYSREFVVVADGRVVDHAGTLEEARLKGSAFPGSYVTYVAEPEMAWVL